MLDIEVHGIAQAEAHIKGHPRAALIEAADRGCIGGDGKLNIADLAHYRRFLSKAPGTVLGPKK